MEKRHDMRRQKVRKEEREEKIFEQNAGYDSDSCDEYQEFENEEFEDEEYVEEYQEKFEEEYDADYDEDYTEKGYDGEDPSDGEYDSYMEESDKILYGDGEFDDWFVKDEKASETHQSPCGPKEEEGLEEDSLDDIA